MSRHLTSTFLSKFLWSRPLHQVLHALGPHATERDRRRVEELVVGDVLLRRLALELEDRPDLLGDRLAVLRPGLGELLEHLVDDRDRLDVLVAALGDVLLEGREGLLDLGALVGFSSSSWEAVTGGRRARPGGRCAEAGGEDEGEGSGLVIIGIVMERSAPEPAEAGERLLPASGGGSSALERASARTRPHAGVRRRAARAGRVGSKARAAPLSAPVSAAYARAAPASPLEVTTVRRRSLAIAWARGLGAARPPCARLRVLERGVGAPGDPSPHVERDLASVVGLGGRGSG